MASEVRTRGRFPRTFLDTNVLIYTDDPRDSGKQSRAVALLKEHLSQRSGVLSIQVLQEYFDVSTRKLRLAAEVAKQRVEIFAKLNVVETHIDDVLAAIDIHRLHHFSLWDSLILRSAKQGGCSVLLTEDMQHGQIIDGIRVVNPFL